MSIRPSHLLTPLVLIGALLLPACGGSGSASVAENRPAPRLVSLQPEFLGTFGHHAMPDGYGPVTDVDLRTEWAPVEVQVGESWAEHRAETAAVRFRAPEGVEVVRAVVGLELLGIDQDHVTRRPKLHADVVALGAGAYLPNDPPPVPAAMRYRFDDAMLPGQVLEVDLTDAFALHGYADICLGTVLVSMDDHDVMYRVRIHPAELQVLTR